MELDPKDLKVLLDTRFIRTLLDSMAPRYYKTKQVVLVSLLLVVLTLGIGCTPQTGKSGPQGIPGINGTNGSQGPQGDTGIQGPPGINGTDGKSAYQLAVENGYTGNVTQWLTSLVGPQGMPGSNGSVGASGIPGPKGDTGPQGLPCQSLIVAMGFVHEDFANQPNGSPELVSGYNVESVVWNPVGPGYIITLTGISYSSREYSVLITPLLGPYRLFYEVGEIGGLEGRIAVWFNRINGSTLPYSLGSFQFVVLKYP